MAAEIAIVPARDEAGKEHRKHRQGVKRERNGDDAKRKRQHGDTAFLQERGEHPLGKNAGLLRPGRQQYGCER